MWPALLLLLTHGAHAADCRPVAQVPAARLYRCEGLHVLYLRGEPKARARAMGGLVRAGALSPEVLDYFSGKFRELADRQSRIAAPFAELAYNQLVRLLHRRAPRDFVEETDALAEALGRDPIAVRRALSLPDVAALTNVLGSVPLFRALPAAGCTSVAARAPDGSLAYGRNLDFAGTGVWDRHPLLTVVLPESGDELKHIAFGADGTLFAGITGVNEAGIGFAVHQNYTSAGGLTGVPMVFLGELVLRRARSLGEALAILEAHRPAVLWTFVLTSYRTGEAVAVESSPTRFAVRRMEGNALVQTNHVMDAGTRAEELAPLGIKINSIYRMKRAHELLAAGRGRPLPETIAGILAYQENPAGRLAAYRDVLKAHTIQTVLLTGGEAYVSIDPAPTAGGRLARFDLASLWRGETPRPGIVDFARTAPEKRARQRQIADAFHLYFDRFALPEAAALLAGHDTLDSRLFTAVTLTQRDRWREALLTADQALANPRFLGEPAYIRQSLEWIKAASLLELGRKEEAAALADAILQEKPENVRLREFAERLSRGKAPPLFMRRFSFDFFSGDLHGRPN